MHEADRPSSRRVWCSKRADERVRDDQISVSSKEPMNGIYGVALESMEGPESTFLRAMEAPGYARVQETKRVPWQRPDPYRKHYLIAPKSSPFWPSKSSSGRA